MTPEQERKLNEIYEWMQSKKRQQISLPVDDASRKNMGLGFIGKGTETTPAGTYIVNSPEGPVKILYAA